ncbi:hypothetical protein ACVW1C_000651 [Bradyrhizobium sp. USDA 4011]
MTTTILTMLPGCLRSRQRGARGLHHVPGAVEIGVDDRVPALDREIDRGLRELAAGAVDEMVDAAMRDPQRVEHRADRVGIPDIGNMRRHLEAAMPETIDERIELVGIASHDHDMRAEPGEQPRDGAADSAGAAGYDDHLTGQPVCRKHGRMCCEFVVGGAERCVCSCVCLLIVHGRLQTLRLSMSSVH